MKKKMIFCLFLLLPLISYSQSTDIQKNPSKDKVIYTLSGFRHGISFFPEVKLPQVQYEAGDTLKFDSYHTSDVIYAWMKKWTEKYPELVDLYEVGKSFEGRPILQMTITCKKTGKDTEKPAAFFEGGRHSGEVTAAECVLWMMNYLLENYDSDPEVKHILDTKAIYLKPVNNPDGHNLFLHTAQYNRSTVRPKDNDGDSLLDEDPPEDLDGDGMILTMRWKDEKKGTWITDPRDSSGRIMKEVPEGEGTYLTATEGTDNDGDGKINEDGIGGLDLHRNYPENWRPDTEQTGRGYTQSGAGEYPLSESETRAVTAFLLSHPNIYAVNSMDTNVPMHLRPPSTSSSKDRMYPEDLKWYELFDEIGKKITGYKKVGDVYDDYGNGTPLFGHGPDFGYFYYGAIWYGDELWNGGKYKKYNDDDTIDQLDIITWDDRENNGDGFIEWRSLKHPVYGDIEVGGFNLKFFSVNPPPRYLETWIRNEGMFNFEMVKYLPELAWENIEVKKIKTYKSDSADYQLKISFRNTGKLPTALKQASLVKIVTSDRVVIELDTTGAMAGKTGYKIIEEQKPAGNKEIKSDPSKIKGKSAVKPVSKNIPFTEGGATTSAIFHVRLYNRTELAGKASVFSTRGGVLKDREFVIR